MEPNDQYNPGQPKPPHPPQRPMQDFRPQHNPQRQFNDFAPRPTAMPTTQRPAHPQQPQHPRETHAASAPVKPYDFQDKRKKKSKIPKLNKLVLALSIVAVFIVVGFAFITLKSSNHKPAVKQNTQPALKPLEKPGFIVYYPSPMPSGLTIAKGSITYYKDSFTFIIEQNGKKSFFIYEQPTSTDPDFNNLKSKLAAPKNITLTIGQGIEGGLDNGTVTAVKTDKNTTIIINCIKTICSTVPRDLLSSMQVNDDLDGLRRSNP